MSHKGAGMQIELFRGIPQAHVEQLPQYDTEADSAEFLTDLGEMTFGDNDIDNRYHEAKVLERLGITTVESDPTLIVRVLEMRDRLAAITEALYIAIHYPQLLNPYRGYRMAHLFGHEAIEEQRASIAMQVQAQFLSENHPQRDMDPLEFLAYCEQVLPQHESDNRLLGRYKTPYAVNGIPGEIYS